MTQLQKSVSDVVRELKANKKRDNREGRQQLYHHPHWNGPRPNPRGKREDDSLPSTSRDTRREEHEGDLPGNVHSPITLCNDGGRGIPPMRKRQRPWQRKMQVNNCSSLVRIFFLHSYSFLRGLRVRRTVAAFSVGLHCQSWTHVPAFGMLNTPAHLVIFGRLMKKCMPSPD